MIDALSTLAVIMAAALFYSSGGWIKRVRRKLDGEEVPFDHKKMLKSVYLGLGLGFGAFLVTTLGIYEVPAVDGHADFVGVFTAATTLIVLIDKWMLGRTNGIGNFRFRREGPAAAAPAPAAGQ